MVRIKMLVKDAEPKLELVGDGADFMDAVIKLLQEYRNHFDCSPWAPIFDGLASLAGGNDSFTHWDFSCPEEAFELTLETL